MKKEEIKIIVSASVAISVVVALIYIIAFNIDLNITNIARALSFGLSITTVFWTFHFSYGWKMPILESIFYRPNLNGTWSGTLNSDWKDSEGRSIDPIVFHIVIRQSFLRIHFRTFTSNFEGVSYAETLSLKKDQGLKNIAYLYRKETSQLIDDDLQEGAAELRLIESQKKRLEGKYWSNRKTNGKIVVEFVSINHVDCFDDAIKLGPNG